MIKDLVIINPLSTYLIKDKQNNKDIIWVKKKLINKN